MDLQIATTLGLGTATITLTFAARQCISRGLCEASHGTFKNALLWTTAFGGINPRGPVHRNPHPGQGHGNILTEPGDQTYTDSGRSLARQRRNRGAQSSSIPETPQAKTVRIPQEPTNRAVNPIRPSLRNPS